MRTFPGTITAVAACFSATILTSIARGDIIDDILSVARAGRDRATEARERAKEARDTSIQIRNRVEFAAKNLNNEVFAAISGPIENVKSMIAGHIEGMEEFRVERCESFRSELLQVLHNMQALHEAINELTQPPGCLVGAPDDERGSKFLSHMIAQVESMDCTLLYPLFKGLPDLCILRELEEDLEALRTIGTILRGSAGAKPPAPIVPLDTTDPTALLNAELLTERLAAVQPYLEKQGVLEAWINGRAKRLSLTLKVSGKSLIAASKLLKFSHTVGIHGYLGLDVKPDAVSALGEALVSLGDAIKEIATDADQKLKEATLVSAVHFMLSNQTAMLKQILNQLVSQNNGQSTAGLFGPLGSCGTVAMTGITLVLAGLVRRNRTLPR